jgi:hypothetical protein
MTTQNKNFKNFSGGPLNDTLPTYNRCKIPKSRKTVSLKIIEAPRYEELKTKIPFKSFEPYFFGPFELLTNELDENLQLAPIQNNL